MSRITDNNPAAPRRIRTVLCACLLWPALSALAAPPVRLVSLDEALRLAVQRAPSLEARDAQVTAAVQEAARAGSLPDPMLMTGLNNVPVTGANAFSLDAEMMTMTRIGLRQEFPARAKRDARERFALRNVDQAEALVLAEQLAVRRAVADAWIDAWAAQRERDALLALREQAALAAQLSRAQVSGGESATNALAAEAALLEMDNRLQANEAEWQGALSMLARWLGDGFGVDSASEGAIRRHGLVVDHTAGDASAGGRTTAFESLPAEEAALLASLDGLGPLLAWEAGIEASAAAVDLARAETKPDWSVTAAYGQRRGGRSDMLTVEFAIGLPVFSANRQDRGIAAREADYQATLASREDARRQLAAEIRRGFADWQGLRAQTRRDIAQLLPLARDRSEVALAAYRGGAPLQPWLDARRDQLEILAAHAERLRRFGQAWAALAFLLPDPDTVTPAARQRFDTNESFDTSEPGAPR
jgi:outer membrane protein TolC